MPKNKQVSVKNITGTEECLDLVALLVMEINNFLYSYGPSSLILLNNIRTGLIFQILVIVKVALRIQIVCHLKSLLNGSHSKIAHMRELGCVLMHCLVEALNTAVCQRKILNHVFFVNCWQVLVVILPSLQHLFCARN